MFWHEVGWVNGGLVGNLVRRDVDEDTFSSQ